MTPSQLGEASRENAIHAFGLVVSLTLFVGGYNVGHDGLTLKPL